MKQGYPTFFEFLARYDLQWDADTGAAAKTVSVDALVCALMEDEIATGGGDLLAVTKEPPPLPSSV